jgi:hypothetical protein
MPARLRRLARWLPAICLCLLIASRTLAQDTGQVCVQSYEDYDADGRRDAGESAIASGIGASLQNAAGVTIATRLLEDSPFAARGLLCFEQLPAGDYGISVTSAEYTGVAESTFAATVNPGAAPALLEFGARPLDAATGRESAGIAVDSAAAIAAAKAFFGSMVAGALMSVIGLLVYLLIFRRRMRRASRMPNASPAPAVGDLTAQASERQSGADPLGHHAPSAGSPPLFANEAPDKRGGAD